MATALTPLGAGPDSRARPAARRRRFAGSKPEGKCLKSTASSAKSRFAVSARGLWQARDRGAGGPGRRLNGCPTQQPDDGPDPPAGGGAASKVNRRNRRRRRWWRRRPYQDHWRPAPGNLKGTCRHPSPSVIQVRAQSPGPAASESHPQVLTVTGTDGSRAVTVPRSECAPPGTARCLAAGPRQGPGYAARTQSLGARRRRMQPRPGPDRTGQRATRTRSSALACLRSRLSLTQDYVSVKFKPFWSGRKRALWPFHGPRPLKL
jgi:hypothetical protein